MRRWAAFKIRVFIWELGWWVPFLPYRLRRNMFRQLEDKRRRR
jgi:hypothetical protein